MKYDMSDDKTTLPDLYTLPGEYIGSEVADDQYPRLETIEQEKGLIPYEGNEVANVTDDDLIDVTYSVSDDDAEQSEDKKKLEKPKLPKIPDNTSGSGPSYLGQQSITDYVPDSNESSGAGGSFGSLFKSNIGAGSFSANVGNVDLKKDNFDMSSGKAGTPTLSQGKVTDASPSKAPTARSTSESSGGMMKNGAISSGSVNHSSSSLCVSKAKLPSGGGHTQSYSNVGLSSSSKGNDKMSEVLVMLINNELDTRKPNEYPPDIAEGGASYVLGNTPIEDLSPADLNYVAKELGLN